VTGEIARRDALPSREILEKRRFPNLRFSRAFRGVVVASRVLRPRKASSGRRFGEIRTSFPPGGPIGESRIDGNADETPR